MYESNAIQFGMDQMLEASSEQLSSFIQWYFWCVNVGPLFIYVIFGLNFVFTKCIIEVDQIHSDISNLFGEVLVPVSFVQLALSLCGIIFMFLIPRWFSIKQVSKKPLKIIFGVLNYSLKHNYPERRSAFTYWENDIPSRIDLGKEKYGGPFTNEQVDVKTMFRLSLLMVSLCGYISFIGRWLFFDFLYYKHNGLFCISTIIFDDCQPSTYDCICSSISYTSLPVYQEIYIALRSEFTKQAIFWTITLFS